MANEKTVLKKETGQLKPKGQKQVRKYDLVDLFSIALYNLAVLGAGVVLGWYMCNVGASN